MTKADYILKSNYIFTAQDTSYTSGVVVIAGEKILAVMKKDEPYDAYVDAHTKVVDCKNQLIMPGFIDAHVHFIFTSLCNSPYAVLFYDCKSEQECVDMVAAFRKENPDVDRIYGFGWLNTAWGEGVPFPSRHSIDAAVPDIPVYLHSLDGHNYWINSKAIEECGFTKDSTATFGGFEKDESGQLTGIILDLEATTLPVMNGTKLAKSKMKQITLNFMGGLNQYGITSLADVAGVTYPFGEYGDYAAYDELNEELPGGLPVRMFLYPSLGSDGDFSIVNDLRARYQATKVHIAGLKQFIDGVAISHTAYTLEPYTDDPSIDSKPFYSREVLKKVVAKANREGYSVRLHAISDGSVRLGLDIYEAAQKGADMNKITNTLEHLDNVDPADIPRFAQLGVIPSMQPAHMSLTETYFVDKLGERRAKLAYPHRALLDTGATLAFGTDNPCVPYNPFQTIHYAMTRCNFSGKPLTQNPQQEVTLGEALRAYTYGAACAVNASESLGTLAPGKYADIVVVDGSLFGEEPEQILKRKAVLTFSAGMPVYEAK